MLDPSPPDPPRPWHFMPDHETRREHEMFLAWLHFGHWGEGSAGLRAVAKRFSIALESIQLLAAVKHWEQRAGAYRGWLQTVSDRASEEEAASLGRARLGALSVVCSAIDEARAALQQEKIARDLRRGMSSIGAVEAMRLAMKAPAAVAQLAALSPPEVEGADDLDYGQLSLDELAALRRLHEKAKRRPT